MRVTKEQVLACFQEAFALFETEIQPIPNGVELRWMALDEFKESVLANSLYATLNERGFINLEQPDFPSFAVVFPSDKHLLRTIMELPFQIHVCWEYLEGTLLRMSTKQGKLYLKGVFLHELVHLVEDQLVCQNQALWQECLVKAHGSDHLAKEVLAERLPESLLGPKCAEATREAWRPIEQAILKAQSQR